MMLAPTVLHSNIYVSVNLPQGRDLALYVDKFQERSKGKRTYLAPLNLFRRHNNDTRVFLKHHAPEVAYCVLQAALRGDVASL